MKVLDLVVHLDSTAVHALLFSGIAFCLDIPLPRRCR